MAFRIPGDTVAESRFRRRMESAQLAQEEQERQKRDAVTRQLEIRRIREDVARWKERTRFELYVLTGMILDRMMEVRDRNIPTVPDGEWNEEFCKAVRTIPEVKELMEEMRH